MKSIVQGLILGVALLNAGCRPDSKDSKAEGFGTGRVSLKGTYGVKRGPEVEPVLKVEEEKTGGYAFEERTLGEWGPDPEVPHTTTEIELRRDFGGPVYEPVYGLATAKVRVYKLPAGWSRGPFKTMTGYILFSGDGPIELTKMLRD